MIRVDWSQGDTELFVSFRYSKEANAKMARLPGATFERDEYRRGWRIGIDQYPIIHVLFPGSVVGPPVWRVLGLPQPPKPKWWQELQPLLEQPFPEIREGRALFGYQVEGANFALQRLLTDGMANIYDEMGLGKTPQAVAIIAALRRRHGDRFGGPILWITKAPLVTQTIREGFEEFSDLKVLGIIGDAKQRKKLWAQEADVYLCGYELVLRDHAIMKQLSPQLIVFDEVHKIKNRTGQMYGRFYKLIRDCKSAVLSLTGTPVQNRPEELYSLFAIHPTGETILGEWSKFAKRYLCMRWNGKYQDLEGYAHLDELAEKIAPYYIRRERQDVGIQIPKIIGERPQEHWVEPTDLQRELFNELTERETDVKLKLSGAKDEAERTELAEKQQGVQLVQIMVANDPALLALSESPYIRQKYGHLRNAQSPKRDLFNDLVVDLAEIGKVLVFSRFRRQVLLLAEELKKLGIGYVIYTSSESTKQRDEAIRLIRTDPRIKVMLATDAASDGLNLQVCRSVIHMDTPWNPKLFDQRNGRVIRPNSPHSDVLIVQLLCKDSIDLRILQSNATKRNLSDTLIIA